MTENISVEDRIADVSKAVAQITATEVGIAKLGKKYQSAVFAVDKAAGMMDAKKARKEIRAPRYNIENIRKDAKAPVIALGRSIDSLAKDLTAELLLLETPIDAQIKAEEGRIAAAKQKLIDDENDRVQGIKDRIEKLFDGIQTVINSGKGSEYVGKCIAAYKDKPIDDSYAEFKDDAQRTWDSGLTQLENHLSTVTEMEYEAKRIADERAELAELRDIQEKRDAADAKEREKAEAERIAKEAEDRKVLDAQRKDQEAAQEIINAENDRIAAENSALEQKKRDDELAQQAEQIAENDRKLAAMEAAKKAKYPGDDAIITALSEHFGVHLEVASKWVSQIKGDV